MLICLTLQWKCDRIHQVLILCELIGGKLMKNDMSIIIKNFLCFFLRCLPTALVVGLIYLDVKTFGNILEASFVETGQAICLLFTSIIFMYLARKKNANGLWLVAGFFMCLFIRELDAYFDDLFHGSWKYFALVCAIVFSCKAWNSGKEKALSTLAVYMESKSFVTMSFGMIVVLLFSRAMGMGKLWKMILGENFNRSAKNVVEEGIEFFGYSIIFLAAVEYAYYLLNKGDSQN